MKKILSAVAAVGLSVAMALTSVAYVATPEKSSENQIKLVSIKAVDVQTAISGVRSYSELTDTTSGYQVNDPIYLATTVEVRNLEKSAYRSLTSIEDKDVATVVGSAYVDLSYSKYATPILLSHIYSGINDAAIGTFADVISVSSILDYDKDKNEVKFEFHGYEQNAVTWLTGFSTASYNNIYLSAYVRNDKIWIPALRAKDGKNTVTFGNASNTYTYSWDAPDSMAYTLVLSGVTKDNAGAAQGDFYAKIEISGAEKFVDKWVYYVDKNGDVFDYTRLEAGKDRADWEAYVDYLPVTVRLLEIENSYNVYKYEVRSSALYGTKVPVVYFGEDDDYYEKVVAQADPNRWDYATGKTTKTSNAINVDMTDVNTAGGVTSVDAWFEYTYNSSTKTFTSTNKKSVPLTGTVYTELATVYAPSFFAGYVSATSNSQVKWAYSSTFKTQGGSTNDSVVTVDEFRFEGVVFDNYPNGRNLDVVVWDAIGRKLVRNQATGNQQNSEYDVEFDNWKPNTPQSGYYTVDIVVKPKSQTVYPITAIGSSGAQQAWDVLLGTPLTIPDTTGTTGTYVDARAYDPNWTLPANTAAFEQSHLATYSVTAGLAANPPRPALTANATDYIVYRAGTLQPADIGPTAGQDGLRYSDALTGGANMQSAPANVQVKTSAKNLNNTYTGILATDFYETWDRSTLGNESVSGNKVDLTDSSLELLTVEAIWSTNNEVYQRELAAGNPLPTGRLFGNGVSAESFDPTSRTTANMGYAEFSNNGVMLVPDKSLKTDAWDNTDTNHVSANYSTAFIAAETPNDYTGTITSVSSAGWAQTNGFYATGQSSYGKPNAYLAVSYRAATGDYSFNKGNTTMYGLVDIVEDGHNGIDVYVITFNSDDQPIVAIATEATYFESQSGYGIAMFDAHNLAKLGVRVSRSSNENMTYADGSGSVSNSSRFVSALRYFGLDTSLSTTYRIIEDTFEAKGAAAVYSENVTGTFNYGTLTLWGEDVEEDTVEEEIDDNDDEIDDVDEDPIEDDIDDEPIVDEPAPVAPKTGDSSVNIAIALAAAAIVAAAGLVFVMKKAR